MRCRLGHCRHRKDNFAHHFCVFPNLLQRKQKKMRVLLKYFLKPPSPFSEGPNVQKFEINSPEKFCVFFENLQISESNSMVLIVVLIAALASIVVLTATPGVPAPPRSFFRTRIPQLQNQIRKDIGKKAKIPCFFATERKLDL